jgi:hypothetical protein
MDPGVFLRLETGAANVQSAIRAAIIENIIGQDLNLQLDPSSNVYKE